jgi:3D (Asp-Asp-Asp) domain-containing protein
MKAFSVILALSFLFLFTLPAAALSNHHLSEHYRTQKLNSYHRAKPPKLKMKKAKATQRFQAAHRTKIVSRSSNRFVLAMRATAYSARGGITKSGTRFREGIIAVDPKIIPLGTRVYVEGYGEAIADDTGGKIKGHRIDVAFNTHRKAINWGVKYVKVRILEFPE